MEVVITDPTTTIITTMDSIIIMEVASEETKMEEVVSEVVLDQIISTVITITQTRR